MLQNYKDRLSSSKTKLSYFENILNCKLLINNLLLFGLKIILAQSLSYFHIWLIMEVESDYMDILGFYLQDEVNEMCIKQ